MSFSLFCRGLVLWLCCVTSVSALDWKSDIILSPPALNYTGPADSVAQGNIIGSQWSAIQDVETVFWCGWIFACTWSTMDPGPDAIPTGEKQTVDGVDYTVFETGVPGVGFIIGLKDFSAMNYVPLQSTQTQTYPAEGTNDYANKLGWSAKVTFVKTGKPLATGVYSIDPIHAAVLTAYNNETKTAQVIINPTTITVAASGCTVGTKAASVDLGRIDMRTMPTVGSISAFGSFTVELACDADIALYGVVTDQTDPGNRSTAVRLTGDSTAKGVGVQFFYNGQGPLSLGRDSSNSGSEGQFFIQRTSQKESLVLPLQVRYVRTSEDMVPGSANALASITFSYQ